VPADVQRITDPDRIRNYLRDESAAFEGHADTLFLPADEDELAQVLAEATRREMPVTVSGAGTSITGSRVPVHGGAVLSVERMTGVADRPGQADFERIERGGFSLLLDVAGRRAVLPPAITLTELDDLLAPHGLLYPPDPTEMAAMLGGTVATNAAGARSFHYGPTRAWVRRLRIVLPDGDRVELRRGEHLADGRSLVIPAAGGPRTVPLPRPADYWQPNCKNAAGLFLREDMDAIDLFIGSEGILGVVSEVEVALQPRPVETLTVVAYFAATQDALEFVDFVSEKVSGTFCRNGPEGASHKRYLTPFPPALSLEFCDGQGLDWLRPTYGDIPAAGGGAVLFEMTYAIEPAAGPYPPTEMIERVREALKRFRAVADWAAPTEEREALRLFRHALPESVNAFGRAHQGKLGTDMAVPHDRFREFYAAGQRLAGASGVRFVTWGHIGDDHLHLNFLARDADEMARARAAYVALAQTAVALGGTVSAEHGVGKKQAEIEPGRRVPYLALMVGETGLKAIADIKRVLDPAWILNVGNMVPPEAARWT